MFVFIIFFLNGFWLAIGPDIHFVLEAFSTSDGEGEGVWALLRGHSSSMDMYNNWLVNGNLACS